MSRLIRILAGLGVLVCLIGVVLAVAVPDSFWSQLWPHDRGNGQIRVETVGNPPAAALQDVKLAAEKFPDFIASCTGNYAMQDVSLYLAADEDTYQSTLSDKFDLKADEADNIARVSGGWTGGATGITVINAAAGVMSDKSNHYTTTAHELFHQLQYALAQGHDTDDAAIFWLEEGSADFVGAALCEELGGRTVDKWHLDVELDLLGAAKLVKIEALQHCNQEQRIKLMQQDLHTYQLSDLMTWYLVTHYVVPGQSDSRSANQAGVKALAAYFKELQETHDGPQAFERAFGVSLDAFLQDFRKWWGQERRSPLQLDIEARSGVSQSLRDSFTGEAGEARGLLRRLLGSDMHGHYHVILAANADDMAAAARQKLGLGADEAKKMAGDSLWVEHGSTLIMNAGELSDGMQRRFIVGTMLMRLYESQYMNITGRADDTAGKTLEWLQHGAGYLMGVQFAIAGQRVTLADYQRNWQQELHGSPLTNPIDLASTKGYKQAEQEYGNKAVSEFSEYAAAGLLQHGGWRSIQHWLQQTRTQGDAARAFRSVYGRSADEFLQQVRLTIR